MVNENKKKIIKNVVGKMIDIGKTYKPLRDLSVKSDGPQKSYPSFYVDAKQVPFMEEYEVGDEVTLTVKVKIIGHEVSETAFNGRDDYHIQVRKMGETE